MKRFLVNGFVAFAVVAMLLASQPASAVEPPINPTADLIILRPFGLAMLAGGTVLMAPVGLWTLLVRPSEMDVPFNTFMRRPFEYTFVDPLGSH
jgi:hypothetical protein